MGALSWLLQHWQLKLLSVVFAVLLWAFVVSEDRHEVVLAVPLDLIDRPAGLEVVSMGVEAVVVRLEGLRGVVSRLRDDDLRAEVSLRDARPGRFVARLAPDNVRVPRGVRVVQVTPSQVNATLIAATPVPR
jgi:hypothetical protein